MNGVLETMLVVLWNSDILRTFVWRHLVVQPDGMLPRITRCT